MVQSVLIAARFTDEVIEYVKNRRRIEEKMVRLLSYRVDDQKQSIELKEGFP
jgi:hypothetical protein